MTRNPRFRAALFGSALALNIALLSAAAPAALDLAVGARSVVPDKPVSDCSAKAKATLTSLFQNAFEAGPGSGQWIARGPSDRAGNTMSEIAIHCNPVDGGYVVTFTCAVEVPPSPELAGGLCDRVSTAFGVGKQSKQ